MTDGIRQVNSGETLWGIAKEQLKKAQGDSVRITNQQIVDAMKAIASANGSDDFEAFGKLQAGQDIKIPGFHLENGRVAVQKDETPVQEETNEPTVVAEDTPEVEPSARQNSSIGPALALGAKGYVKRNQIKTMLPTAKKQYNSAKMVAKRQLNKAKGKVLKAKTQFVRNTAASKIKNARKAQANFKAEQQKLKDLRAKQAEARKNLTNVRKQSYKVDASGKKITSKEELAAAKKAKAERIKKAQNELDKINKQIQKQRAAVSKAQTKKVAANESAKLAKKKVTKLSARTTGKTTTKAATKAVSKEVQKEAVKTAGKAFGKTALKKIPFVGLAAGVVFAADRAMHGDFAGAGMEVASGALSCVPGAGTAASVAVDVAIAARDIHASRKS